MTGCWARCWDSWLASQPADRLQRCPCRAHGEHPPEAHFQANTIELLANLPQPVISAVHGHCYTGALELALAGDMIVPGESAKFADAAALDRPVMHEEPHDLQTITSGTLAYYDRNAQAFWDGTRDHDVQQNIEALLQHIKAEPPFELLDCGCGPGRDLMRFTARGHRATGLDGSSELAALARAHSGCEVLQQNFLALELPPVRFDGVFANASLFHVPGQVLPRVLKQLHAALKPGGVLFSSNPRGDGQQGWNGGRYGVYHDWDGWRAHLLGAGFVPLTHYYRPAGLPRAQQPWLASVWRKPAVA